MRQDPGGTTGRICKQKETSASIDHMAITLTLRMSGEMRDRIDAARGDVPREKWMRGVLEQRLRELGQAPVTQNRTRTKGKEAPDRSPTPAPARASEGGRGGVERISPNGEVCPACGSDKTERAAIGVRRGYHCKTCGERWPA